MKRLFDIAASLAGLVLLAPVLLGIAIAIKLDSSGPVLFRQQRIGRRGMPFMIHKFRSMRAAGAAAHAPQITIGTDPRITRVGRLLRHYKLDELPQLVDVLRGKMSIVGPRPEVPRYVELYPDDIRDTVLSVRPGITDRSSILFRNEADLLSQADDPEAYYIDEIMPVKLEHHVYYVQHQNFIEDIRIIFATLKAI